jgi:hypothetical protein
MYEPPTAPTFVKEKAYARPVERRTRPLRLLEILELEPGWIGYRPMHARMTAKKQTPMWSFMLGARGVRIAKEITRHVYVTYVCEQPSIQE